jgi:hypothetical protein
MKPSFFARAIASSMSFQKRLFWDSARASRSVSSVTGTSAAHGRPFLVIRTAFGQLLDVAAEPRFDLANVLDFHRVTFLPPMGGVRSMYTWGNANRLTQIAQGSSTLSFAEACPESL